VPPLVRQKAPRFRTLSEEERATIKSNKRLHALIISQERDIKYSPQMAEPYDEREDVYNTGINLISRYCDIQLNIEVDRRKLDTDMTAFHALFKTWSVDNARSMCRAWATHFIGAGMPPHILDPGFLAFSNFRPRRYRAQMGVPVSVIVDSEPEYENDSDCGYHSSRYGSSGYKTSIMSSHYGSSCSESSEDSVDSSEEDNQAVYNFFQDNNELFWEQTSEEYLFKRNAVEKLFDIVNNTCKMKNADDIITDKKWISENLETHKLWLTESVSIVTMILLERSYCRANIELILTELLSGPVVPQMAKPLEKDFVNWYDFYVILHLQIVTFMERDIGDLESIKRKFETFTAILEYCRIEGCIDEFYNFVRMENMNKGFNTWKFDQCFADFTDKYYPKIFEPQMAGLFYDKSMQADLLKAVSAMEELNANVQTLGTPEAFGNIGTTLQELIGAMKGEALGCNIDMLSTKFSELKQNFLGAFFDSENSELTELAGLSLVGAAAMMYYFKPSKLSLALVGFTIGYSLVAIPSMRRIEVVLGFGILITAVTAVEMNRRDKLVFIPHGMNSDNLDDVCTALASFFGIGFQCIFGKNLGLDFVRGLGDFTKIKRTFSDIFSAMIRAVEGVINHFREGAMKPCVRFLDSNRTNVNAYLERIKNIFERNSRGVFTFTHEHFNELETLLFEGNEILRKCGNDRNDMNLSRILSKDIKKIETIYSNFLNSNFDIAGSRAEAFGVMLGGGAGVGKSNTMKSLSYAIAARFFKKDNFKDFMENPKNYTYVRNTENVYWDGLTWRHWFTFWDDFGQAVDVAGNPANEMFEWIRAVNPFEYRVHKAGMEEKGLITFNSKIVIGNTNVRKFKAKSIHEIKALVRRFNVHVCVIPKPEFELDKGEGGTDIWNKEFDFTKLPRTDSGLTVFDHTVQLFVPIDKNGDAIGDPYDFDVLLQKCIDGITIRQQWKESNQEMLEDLAIQYRDEALDVDVQMEVVPQMAAPFSKMSVKDFIQVAHNDGTTLNFGADKERAETFAVEWLTIWHPLLVKEPEFFRELDCLTAKIWGHTNAPYAVKIAALVLMKEFPLFDIGDGPDTMTMALKCFRAYLDAGSLECVAPEDLMDYNKSIQYSPENYDAFFLDFDRMLEHPEISKARKAHKWIKKNKVPLLSMAAVVWALISIPFIYHCGKWIVSFFSKEEVENEPQSGNVDGRSKAANKKQTVNERIAKLGLNKPQMGAPLDTNGQSILESVMRSNYYALWELRDDNPVKLLGNLTFVYGRIFMIPFHYLRKLTRLLENGVFNVNTEFLFKRYNSGFSFKVRIADIVKPYHEAEMLNNDLVMIQLPECYPNHRDIRKFFAKNKDLSKLGPSFQVAMAGCVGGTCFTLGNLSGALPVSDYDGKKKGKPLDYYEVENTISYHVASKEGDCGALAFIMNSKVPLRKIYGMHVAGCEEAGIGFSGIVTQELIEEYMKNLEIGSSLMVDEDIIGDPTIIVPQMANLGKIKEFTTRNTTSRIKSSPLYGTLIRKYTQPARLRPFIGIDGVEIDPMAMAYKKYGNNKTLVDREILQSCVLSYFEKVIEGPRITKRELLTVEEAIHGIESDEASVRINPSSSAGHPMTNKTSRNLKKLYYESEGSEKEAILDEIKAEVEKYVQLMIQGYRPCWYYQDNNKDERLNFKKAQGGKVRLFSGSPFIFLILVKIYFGAFINDYTKKRLKNGSTLGVNTYSEEWDVMVRLLAQVNPKLDTTGSGDYSHYDGDHIPEIEFGSLDIIDMWYGYELSGDAKKIRHILYEDCVFSFHILDGEVIEWVSGMPSGHPLTPIINTMYNNLIFRYAWVLCKNPIDLFNVCVVFFANGDDNVFSVNPNISLRFQPKMITEAMAKIGMTYTNEFKSEEDLGFRHVSQVQFLKRGFKWDKDFHRWVAPLELNTVLDIINWTHAGSEFLTTIRDNMSNVIRELSLHGKSIFEENVPVLLRAYERQMSLPILPICYHKWYDVYRTVLHMDSNLI
jgi:hypothetical protein